MCGSVGCCSLGCWYPFPSGTACCARPPIYRCAMLTTSCRTEISASGGAEVIARRPVGWIWSRSWWHWCSHASQIVPAWWPASHDFGCGPLRRLGSIPSWRVLECHSSPMSSDSLQDCRSPQETEPEDHPEPCCLSSAVHPCRTDKVPLCLSVAATAFGELTPEAVFGRHCVALLCNACTEGCAMVWVLPRTLVYLSLSLKSNGMNKCLNLRRCPIPPFVVDSSHDILHDFWF